MENLQLQGPMLEQLAQSSSTALNSTIDPATETAATYDIPRLWLLANVHSGEVRRAQYHHVSHIQPVYFPSDFWRHTYLILLLSIATISCLLCLCVMCMRYVVECVYGGNAQSRNNRSRRARQQRAATRNKQNNEYEQIDDGGIEEDLETEIVTL